MAALGQVGNSGVSFAELTDSWSDLIRTLRIRRINLDGAIRGFNLNLLNNPEKPLPVSAREVAVGTTSPEVVGKWKAFAEAMAPNSQAVISLGVDRRLVTAPSAQVLSGKRKSNVAVKREAKAKRDRRLQKTAIFDMSQMNWPQWEAQDLTIRSWVTSYKPELTSDEEWSISRPAYLRLMSLAKPVSTTRALNVSSHLATYLKWIADRRPKEKRSEVLALSEVGTLKSRSGIGLTKGYFAVGGQVQLTILGTIALAVLNYQTTLAWIERGGITNDDVFDPPPPFFGKKEMTGEEDQERRRVHFEELKKIA
jgi:hypothetical protein